MPKISIPKISNPAHANPYEVRSPSGLEGVFANEGDAEFHADELRRAGVSGVVVERKVRQRVGMARGNPGSHREAWKGAYRDLMARLQHPFAEGWGYPEANKILARYNEELIKNERKVALALKEPFSYERVFDHALAKVNTGLAHAIGPENATELLERYKAEMIAKHDLVRSERGNPAPQLGDKYVLGTWAPGSRVQLSEFKPARSRIVTSKWDQPGGAYEPGDWVTVVGNYADTTGVVVVKLDRNGATVEKDGRHPLWEVDPIRSTRQHQKRNPAGLTAKGERMYAKIKRGYEQRGEPRAAEIASRTVLSRARSTPGLKSNPRGALTYRHFYATGAQDCANVINLDEFDLDAGTAEQIVAKATSDFDDFEREWINQHGVKDFEGLDPHEAFQQWQAGWRDAAARIIREEIEERAHRDEDEGE